jgi:hypothetical protein
MRLGTVSCAVLSVIAAAVPAVATTASRPFEVFVPQPASATQPLSHFTGRAAGPAERAVAVQRRELTRLAAAGVPAALLTAAQAAQAPRGASLVRLQDSSTGVVVVGGGFASSVLLPAADLNGDGVRDLLDVRYGRQSDGRQQVLTAPRSGSTGRVLWSRLDTMAAGHFVFPIPTSVGPAGHPGIALLDVGFEKRGSDTMDVSDRLTALDGPAGRRLWQHGDRGTVSFANGFSGTHAPSISGFLQAGPGAKSAMITVSDYSDDGSGQQHGTLTVYRVSGATGAATRDGATVTSSDAIPVFEGFSDLSGDGREDYVVLTAGASPQVEARRGDTGNRVWVNTSLALQPGAYALPAGRVLGGAVEDVAVSTSTPARNVPAVGTPAGDVPDPTTPAHGQVALIRGTTGEQVWAQTGDGAFAVARAGSSKVAAVGVTTADTTNDANGTTETLHVQAYDVAGTQLYDQTYSVTAPADSSDSQFSFGVAAAFAAGDLQKDGAQEGLAFLFALNGNNTSSRTVLFDGAAGTEVPGHHDIVGGTLTGAGDDLLDVTAGATITVVGRSGRDQHALFTRRLRPHAGTSVAYGYGTPIRGRCADVVVLADSKTASYAAVLTSTGVPRWSIEHGQKDLTAKAPTSGAASAVTTCR